MATRKSSRSAASEEQPAAAAVASAPEEVAADDVDTDEPKTKKAKTGKQKKEEDENQMKDDSAAAAASSSSSSSSSDGAAAASSSSSSSSSISSSSSAVDVDLSGKKFVVMGGFKMGKFRVESEIMSVGGVMAANINRSVDYVVCGEPVRTDYGGVSGKGSKKYKDAKKLKLAFLDEAAFASLIADHRATKKRLAANINDNVIPDIQNIINEYAADAGPAQQWIELNEMMGCKDSMPPPATDAEIAAVEERMQLALPQYLKDLYKVSNGSGGGWDEDRPHEVIFPPLCSIVEQWEAGDPAPHDMDGNTTNMFGQYAKEMWRKLKFLPLSNHQEAGDSIKCIDLQKNWVLTLDFDHEGPGMWFEQSSIPLHIEWLHRKVKKAFDEMAAKVKEEADKPDGGKSELQLMREAVHERQQTRQRRFASRQQPNTEVSTEAPADDAAYQNELMSLRRILFSCSPSYSEDSFLPDDQAAFDADRERFTESYKQKVWNVVYIYLGKLGYAD